MLPNEHLISGLTPIIFRGDFLLFSNHYGGIYKLNINNLNLEEENLLVFYHCNIFTLEQKQQKYRIKTKITFNKSNIIYHDDNLPEVDDFSLYYNPDAIEIILYFNQSKPKVIKYMPRLQKTECMEYNIERLPAKTIDSKNSWRIDTECKTIAVDNDVLAFDMICCISDSGVIYAVETEHSTDLFFLAANKNSPLLLSGKNEQPVNAFYDENHHFIYITVNKNCQQYIDIYDFNKHRISHNTGISGRLFGTIQPIQKDNQVMFFVTGSLEGGYLCNNKIDYKISLFPGNPDLKRLYYDDNKVKVLSIISSETPCLNIIFIHGGPESLEWDNPRLPLVVNTFSKEKVNFHILNYAGSKGFGRNYRESINQNVLEGTITPMIDWMNKASPHTRLVLIGGSFGGTLALELLTNAYKVGTNILALVLTNPLIDLPFHMRRVQEKGGDLSFFLRKFSPSDISSITVKRYADTLTLSKVKTLLLLGRHDEILTVKPAITLLKKLKGTQNVTAYLDDGPHASLPFALIREKKMVNFLTEILQLCCALA